MPQFDITFHNGQRHFIGFGYVTVRDLESEGIRFTVCVCGVDFLMPVFWGIPARYDGWSFTGFGPLVQAHSKLQSEGKEPPMIGLFYDTSILQWNDFRRSGSGQYHVDLSTDFGKDWFYTAMRDYFSLIPPTKWARIDGKPIVFLYSGHFAKGQDGGQFDYVKKRFRKDFGIEPFIVKAQDWKGKTDATFNLEQCWFMNRCNGVDFRLAILGGELTVSKVGLERPLLR